MLPVSHWENRYSDTNEPDKHGRWARDLICCGLRFGSVTRCTNEGKVWFTARTYFPTNDGNSPLL